MTPAQLIEVAESYVGTRWHHQGRSRAGVDCIGLLVCIARDCGQTVQDESGYGRQPDGRRLRAALVAHTTQLAEPEPGAIVLFRFEQHPMHVGLCGHDGMLIHALASMRKVVKHRLDETWARRIVAVYRFPGVDHG